MYVLMIIGLVVCAIGKLKLTPTITLEGVRARWYGLTLVVTSIPYYWVSRYIFLLLLPSQVIHNQLFMSAIAIVTVIGYMVLLALPFRVSKT
jgi:hypothetical protein